MVNRAQDWLRQAEYDLQYAEVVAQAGGHSWACFTAHQAAEKAVKALHFRHVQDAWGHAVSQLLRDLPDRIVVPAELIERAQVLDTFYIPTRYPDAHAEGAAYEYYNRLQSEEALRYARAIVQFARDALAGS